MKMQGKCFWQSAITILLWMSIALSGNTETITITQMSDNDSDGGITLRQAINMANAMSSTDVTIDFGSLTGSVLLTSDLPAITRSMIINGSGNDKLTIDGNYKYRVFSVLVGEVYILNLTISHAYAKGGNGGASQAFCWWRRRWRRYGSGSVPL